MNVAEIKEKVFKEKLVFAEIYRKYQNKNWNEYLEENKIPKSSLSKVNLELIDTVRGLLIPLLGQNKASETANALKESFFVSTADHHGILCHPFFLNSSLARSSQNTSPPNKKTISFTCGSVSLSNSSYPRGIFFHDENLEEVRVPFVSLKYRSRSVYGMKPLSKEDFQKSFNKALVKLDGKTEDKIEFLKEKILQTKKIFGVETLSDQFTILNDILWNETFGKERGDLVYFEMETVVRKLLMNIHLENPTIINKIIFDHKWRSDFLQNFEEIQGAHDTKNKKGSHLFWYIDENTQKRVQLFVNGENLESLDHKISIALTPDAINQNLLSYKLLPTMSLSFAVISFYHGLTCGGGFSQVQYLGDMKRAWEKTLKFNGAEMFSMPRTDIFTGEFVIASIKGKKQNMPASLLDLYLYGDNRLSKQIDEKLLEITIRDSIDDMMGEFYKIITGKISDASPSSNIKTVIRAKKQKPKCKYCGNSPTNHFFSNLSQTGTVIFSPLFRMMSYLSETVFSRWIAKIILTPYLWVFRGTRMIKMNQDPSKANTKRSEVIWLEAIKRGIKMEQFILWGKPIEQYRAKMGLWWRYFESIPIPARLPTHSYIWMDDKALIKKKFLKQKLPVAFGGSAFTWSEARKIFEKAVKPVIVKPQLGSRGRHTTTHINTEKDLLKAYKVAKTLCHFVVIEEHLVGSVYRGTYVGGKIVGVLRGDPPRIVGDGVHNISDLIDTKNQTKHKDVKDVVITEQTLEFINRLGFTLDSVLPKGTIIDLSEKIGISYGGFAAEVMPETHPEIISELERAGKYLNAPVIGFDFIIPDVTKDPSEQKWGIIEANSLPFINLHHFPLEGKPVNVAGKVWDLWDQKI